MLNLDQIKLLREKAQEKLQELSKPYYGNNSGVPMTSRELSDRDIRGGLDVRTENRALYVTEKGWDLFNYTDETNMYGPPGAHITHASHWDIDDERLLELMMKNSLSTEEVEQLIKKHKEFCN